MLLNVDSFEKELWTIILNFLGGICLGEVNVHSEANPELLEAKGSIMRNAIGYRQLKELWR